MAHFQADASAADTHSFKKTANAGKSAASAS
jgi:hypothetical protein